MGKVPNQAKKSQAGFTLVELAIVMIIIGLLIGGVLKGQELINNARVTSTAGQVSGFQAALTSFRDMYAGYPGDILNPGNRIPNCTDACAVAGDANNRIDGVDIDAAIATVNNENSAAWQQLAAADLISGVQGNLAAGAATAIGVSTPAANIGGGWHIGYHNGVGDLGDGTPRAGHYLRLDNSVAAAPVAATTSLTPNQAFRIDERLDDGVADTGTVVAYGGDGAALCHTGGVYNEALTGVLCGLYIRVD